MPALDQTNAVEMLRQASFPEPIQPSDGKEISEKFGYNAVLLRLIGHCISEKKITLETAKSMQIGNLHTAIGDTGDDIQDVSTSDGIQGGIRVMTSKM